MLQFERQEACPVCAMPPDDTARRYVSTYANIQTDFVTCDNCGVIWQLTRLADGYLPEYYRDVYRRLTAPNLAAQTHTANVGKLRAQIQGGWLAQFSLGIDTALDYGCSGGWLMDKLADLGLTVCGVEMDAGDMSKPAREKYPVYDTIEAAPGQYDLITMSHVVEHFNHPLESLKPIIAKLKPGGLLFVDVPNYRGLPGFGTGLHHPVCYDAASLARMLGSLGMEVTEHMCYDWDNTPMDKYLMMAAIKPNSRQKRKK
jgi:SAM-dependent methyltransferase